MATLAEKRLTRLEENGVEAQSIAHYLRKLADSLEGSGTEIVGDVRALKMALVLVPADSGGGRVRRRG